MKVDFAKTLKSPVVMVSGEEGALRRTALTGLLAAAGVQPDDFDLQGFSGEGDPSEWLASAGTAPFLAERRTVVVRNLLRGDLDRAKTLEWKALPDSALLVLVADDESGDEDKQRRMKAARGAWEKLVQSAGGAVIKCDAKPGDIKQLVREALEPSGKKISDRALETLTEMCAASASAVLDEMPKLVAYVGGEKTIQEADVRAIVVPSREWNVFRLVDAVVEGNVPEALRQLRILVGSAAKAEDSAYRNIFPQMTRTLRLIWQARSCLDAGVAPDSPQAAPLLLANPSLAGQQEFVRQRAIRSARRLDHGQLAEMLQVLSDADARLKGLLPSFSPMESLEQMVLRMVAVVKPVAGVR